MKKVSGEILRIKREEINLSIEDISVSTKIPKRILKKIENSDFSNITSYQKKYFIKNYAKFLGIDNEIEFIEIYKEEDLLTRQENSRLGISKTIVIDNLFPKILIPILIVTIAIVIFYSHERNNSNYLEKLTAIDNKLSGNFYKEADKSSLITDLSIDNMQLVKPKVEPVSTDEIFNNEVLNEILFLYFKDEVWIQIEDTQEILFSRVFQKNDEISLEVVKDADVFVTSGNLGLVTVKTNHSEVKALGLNGEIGRKKIF